VSVGNVPAIDPGGAVDVVVAVPGSVNAVVVSTFVAVIAVEVVAVAAVSFGTVSVFVLLPPAEPSCTTS
jgi:hypothetical protein